MCSLFSAVLVQLGASLSHNVSLTHLHVQRYGSSSPMIQHQKLALHRSRFSQFSGHLLTSNSLKASYCTFSRFTRSVLLQDSSAPLYVIDKTFSDTRYIQNSITFDHCLFVNGTTSIINVENCANLTFFVCVFQNSHAAAFCETNCAPNMSMVASAFVDNRFRLFSSHIFDTVSLKSINMTRTDMALHLSAKSITIENLEIADGVCSEIPGYILYILNNRMETFRTTTFISNLVLANNTIEKSFYGDIICDVCDGCVVNFDGIRIGEHIFDASTTEFYHIISLEAPIYVKNCCFSLPKEMWFYGNVGSEQAVHGSDCTGLYADALEFKRIAELPIRLRIAEEFQNPLIS